MVKVAWEWLCLLGLMGYLVVWRPIQEILIWPLCEKTLNNFCQLLRRWVLTKELFKHSMCRSISACEMQLMHTYTTCVPLLWVSWEANSERCVLMVTHGSFGTGSFNSYSKVGNSSTHMSSCSSVLVPHFILMHDIPWKKKERSNWKYNGKLFYWQALK